MSKRAEDMAWENYPEHHYLDNDDFDVNEDFRDCYIEGYEQGEKDTIERATSVLVNLPSLVIPSNYIAYFRKKMMEDE